MKKKLEEFQRQSIPQIEKLLKEVVKAKEPATIYEPSRYILDAGGKRMRPMLVLLASKAVGGNPIQALPAAVALEIVHTFTLVHDDIMDHAPSRRGRQTIHKKWDINVAILVGDELLALAYRTLLRTKNNRIHRIAQVFTEGVVEVCEGQGYDKEFEFRQKVTIDDYSMMITKKTGKLISAATEMGGLIGGGSFSHVSALRKFGEHLGRAFQIQDDLLDITGNEKTFGKKIGGDLVEGKKTYLLLTAMKYVRGKDKELLIKTIKEHGVSRKLIPAIKKVYEKNNILTLTQKAVEKEISYALRQLNVLPRTDGCDLLKEYALCMAERKF